MRKLLFLSIIFTFTSLSMSGAVSPVDSTNVAPFGKVYIYNQADSPRKIFMPISGDEGWKSGGTDFAKEFSKLNNLVIGVDILRYCKGLIQSTESCYKVSADFVSKTPEAELITLPDAGHGFSKWSDYMPELNDAFSSIIEKYEKGQTANENVDQLRDLPLIITKAKFQDKDAPVALIISGDGGWYGFEQSIADNLANNGIPSIGLDSRKYFWNRVSPEKTAADMADVLNHFSKEWGRKRFLLIGYSFGAEIIPFIVARLNEEMRSEISSMVLLSPETNTDFEIHFSNMLGIGNPANSYKVIDEIIKTQTVPTLIIFGEDEKTRVPELLTGTTVKVCKIPGAHHYKFNSSLIIQIMKNNKAF